MRITIFYQHALMPGGAPAGIRHFAHALAHRHDVVLWGSAHETGAVNPSGVMPVEGVEIRSYSSHAMLARQLAVWPTMDRPDVVILVGYFLYVNAVVAWAARRMNVPVVLHPIGQVWDEAFRGKIFSTGYDVRALEMQPVNSEGLPQKVARRLSPVVKAIYKHSVGRAIVAMSDFVAVLSSEEQARFVRIYDVSDRRFVQLPWGIDDFEQHRSVDGDYYRDVLGYDDGRANFIVWSRLDWYYKGLDRLLRGVLAAKQRCADESLPFRLFLCGPDYREGTVAASRFIHEHGLRDDVRLLMPGAYEPGTKQPLEDADASILLPRWDGAPRALRESICLGTPVLVSRETNFEPLVREFDAGLIVDRPDEPDCVADALLDLSDRRVRARLQLGTSALAGRLDWQVCAERFLTELTQQIEMPKGAPVVASLQS